jgi:ketosteroid isomerase-like protein
MFAPVSASTTAFTIALAMRRKETTIAAGTVTYVAARDGRPAAIPSTVRGPLGNVAPGGRSASRVAAADLLSRLHDAQGYFYAGGDDARLRAVLDPDARWHVPCRNAIAGEYHGIHAVLEYMTAWRRLAGASFRLHPGEVLIGSNDHIASLTDGSAVIDGTERHWSTAGLYRIEAGRISECHLLPLDPDEFDHIWQHPCREPSKPRFPRHRCPARSRATVGPALGPGGHQLGKAVPALAATGASV